MVLSYSVQYNVKMSMLITVRDVQCERNDLDLYLMGNVLMNDENANVVLKGLMEVMMDSSVIIMIDHERKQIEAWSVAMTVLFERNSMLKIEAYH